jgi:glycosyltransferase involved in cell wall biosynthesis
MKKVLVISYAHDINGAEGALRLATTYWKKTFNWEIDVFHPKGERFTDISLITASGMNPISAIVPGTSYDFILVNLFHNLDWIHHLTNVPIVFWIHEGHSAFDDKSLTIAHLTQTFLKVQSIIFSTKYQSENLFKSFLRNIDPRRIHIAPYAIESLGFKSALSEKSEEFKISWVGSVIARKRPLDLVKAALRLRDSFPIRVDFIGPLFNSWSLGEELIQVRNLENSIFHWHDTLSHEKTWQSVASSDVFCFTSEDESTGLAPLEAASLSVPVILAKLPVYEYIGWRDGVNCLMYPVGDILRLEECIKKIHQNFKLREKLIRNGQALANKFKPQKFLEDITQAVSVL